MKYLPHHRDHDFESIEECDSFYRSAAACLLLVVIIGMICINFVDAWFEEARNQERYYSKPVEVTYKRPAAYRLQSPTPEQMEAYHHLMQIQEVRR